MKVEGKIVNKKTIRCDLHDYIEIACMYGFEVELETKNGEIFSGKAQTIASDSQKQECLVLSQADIQKQVVLSQLRRMRALTQNPHFTTVEFTNQNESNGAT